MKATKAMTEMALLMTLQTLVLLQAQAQMVVILVVSIQDIFSLQIIWGGEM